MRWLGIRELGQPNVLLVSHFVTNPDLSAGTKLAQALWWVQCQHTFCSPRCLTSFPHVKDDTNTGQRLFLSPSHRPSLPPSLPHSLTHSLTHSILLLCACARACVCAVSRGQRPFKILDGLAGKGLLPIPTHASQRHGRTMPFVKATSVCGGVSHVVCPFICAH